MHFHIGYNTYLFLQYMFQYLQEHHRMLVVHYRNIYCILMFLLSFFPFNFQLHNFTEATIQKHQIFNSYAQLFFQLIVVSLFVCNIILRISYRTDRQTVFTYSWNDLKSRLPSAPVNSFTFASLDTSEEIGVNLDLPVCNIVFKS